MRPQRLPAGAVDRDLTVCSYTPAEDHFWNAEPPPFEVLNKVLMVRSEGDTNYYMCGFMVTWHRSWLAYIKPSQMHFTSLSLRSVANDSHKHTQVPANSFVFLQCDVGHSVERLPRHWRSRLIPWRLSVVVCVCVCVSVCVCVCMLVCFTLFTYHIIWFRPIIDDMSDVERWFLMSVWSNGPGAN